MSTSEYEFLRIETLVLKVHMNCQGCMNKVRKVLRKIEGVYKVEIDAEEHKVIVTGTADISTLVQKLAKFGKHAEIWNEDYNQEQVNLVEDNNQSQPQYTVNDNNAYGEHYLILTFGKDQWEHLAQPFLPNNVNNINHQSFNRINENQRWEENNGAHYSQFGNQQSALNLYGMSPIDEYGHQLSPMANIQEYYHNYHLSKPMQQYNYNHLPLQWGINY